MDRYLHAQVWLDADVNFYYTDGAYKLSHSVI
jgi:hypothetical protein